MGELILRERKFREDIVKLINESNLPAIIIKPILKEVIEQVELLEQQQYQKALEERGENDE